MNVARGTHRSNSKIRNRADQNPSWSRLLEYPSLATSGLIQRLTLGLVPHRVKTSYSLPPWSINLVTNLSCDYQCSYCSNTMIADAALQSALPSEWHKPMNPKVWLAVLKKFRLFRPVINIFGGEPLHYPYIFEMIKAFRRDGFFVSMTTNGRHLEAHAKDLVSSGLNVLGVSFDGPPSPFSSITGNPQAHQYSFNGITAFKEAQKANSDFNRSLVPCDIKVILTINSHNYDKIVSTIDEMASLKPDLIAIRHLIFNTPSAMRRMDSSCCNIEGGVEFNFGGQEGNGRFSTIDGRTVHSGIQKAKTVARAAGIPLVVEPEYGEDQCIQYYSNDVKEILPNRPCRTPWNILNIYPNGDAVFCGLYFYHRYGNILTQTANELWNGSKVRELRKILLKESPYPVCERCCARSI